jgi:hypothetical protein
MSARAQRAWRSWSRHYQIDVLAAAVVDRTRFHGQVQQLGLGDEASSFGRKTRKFVEDVEAVGKCRISTG